MKFKEEKYSNLLILLKSFFIGEINTHESKKRFFEQRYQSWLYCSDEVAKAMNNMIKFIHKSSGKELDQEKGKILIGNIVLEMRKDLLGKTKLTSKDFFYTDVTE